ncbi:MAG: response regulator transcription factor [Chloroflexi bacterium]|nr:response regulator transcription factor [Chloroflexota bacterium]
MDKIRVLIVDDNVPLRWALMERIVNEETLEIVEEASDGNEAVEKARTSNPHVVLMDLYMPNCNGVEATRRLKAEMPGVNILMFTVSEAEADLVSALQAGARGYLLKDSEADQVVQAIHFVARGGLLVSHFMAAKLLQGFRKLGPGVEGVPSSAVAPPADAPVTTTTVEERPVAEQAVGQPPEEKAGPEDAKPTGAGDQLASDVDLVLAAPAEPKNVLRFQQWLREVVKGDVRRIKASWGGDTVVSVNFREPVPLFRMLTELPEVAKVVEEPFTGERLKPPEDEQSPASPGQAAQRLEPRQYRLVLKAS